MQQPPGFQDPRYSNHVCHLNLAIYGLKQSPRAWYFRLQSHLIDLGFHNSLVDPSLFFLGKSSHIIALFIYVDDIIVTGSHSEYVNQFIQNLYTTFECRELGILGYFLGMEITHHSSRLTLCLTKYSHDILQRFGMTNCFSCFTLVAPRTKLSKNSSDDFPDNTLYWQMVGALQYLTIT